MFTSALVKSTLDCTAGKQLRKKPATPPKIAKASGLPLYTATRAAIVTSWERKPKHFFEQLSREGESGPQKPLAAKRRNSPTIPQTPNA